MSEVKEPMSKTERLLRIQELNKERGELAVAKSELSAQLAEMGLSHNEKYNKSRHIAQDVIDKRREIASQVGVYEQRLTCIKKELRELNGGNDDFGAKIMDILTELHGRDFAFEVKAEASRRCSGQLPIRVNVRTEKKEAKNYKKELVDLYETMIAARKRINAYIESNEPDINKAEYYTKISPLSKCMPSLPELHKQLQSITKIVTK